MACFGITERVIGELPDSGGGGTMFDWPIMLYFLYLDIFWDPILIPDFRQVGVSVPLRVLLSGCFWKKAPFSSTLGFIKVTKPHPRVLLRRARHVLAFNQQSHVRVGVKRVKEGRL